MSWGVAIGRLFVAYPNLSTKDVRHRRRAHQRYLGLEPTGLARSAGAKVYDRVSACGGVGLLRNLQIIETKES
jgi:hypothetical protein